MKKLKEYLIPFTGLKIGKHQFDYQIDNSFFECFDFDEYNSVDVKVSIALDKKHTMLELAINHKGTVNVFCDKRMIVIELSKPMIIEKITPFAVVFFQNRLHIRLRDIRL